MDIERRTPQNTAIVLIDYMVSFANLFHSQPIDENVNGAVALAKIALGFGAPLVVTSGREDQGPLYPALSAVLGDRPVIRRTTFDSFDNPDFEAAVAATGVKHLVMGGLMTEGCILFTALGALRRGYSVSVVVDASAGESVVHHQTAITRLVQLGVTPVTWLSFASELQRTYENTKTVDCYYGLLSHSPVFEYSRVFAANLAGVHK
jgi:nicotinamidase-related amidase